MRIFGRMAFRSGCQQWNALTTVPQFSKWRRPAQPTAENGVALLITLCITPRLYKCDSLNASCVFPEHNDGANSGRSFREFLFGGDVVLGKVSETANAGRYGSTGTNEAR